MTNYRIDLRKREGCEGFAVRKLDEVLSDLGDAAVDYSLFSGEGDGVAISFEFVFLDSGGKVL